MPGETKINTVQGPRISWAFPRDSGARDSGTRDSNNLSIDNYTYNNNFYREINMNDIPSVICRCPVGPFAHGNHVFGIR